MHSTPINPLYSRGLSPLLLLSLRNKPPHCPCPLNTRPTIIILLPLHTYQTPRYYYPVTSSYIPNTPLLLSYYLFIDTKCPTIIILLPLYRYQIPRYYHPIASLYTPNAPLLLSYCLFIHASSLPGRIKEFCGGLIAGGQRSRRPFIPGRRVKRALSASHTRAAASRWASPVS